MAEIEFWRSIRDSTNPAELKAYLDRYPNGDFAPLARVRMEQLAKASGPDKAPAAGAVAAPPPLPAPPAAPTVQTRPAQLPVSASAYLSALNAGQPLDMTPETIRELQQKLYDLGENITKFDGRMSDELRAVLVRLTSYPGGRGTGQLTQDQFARLRLLPVPKVWGAIAFNGTGLTAGVTARPTRAMAEADALASCNKRSSGCRVAVVSEKRCVGFAFSQGIVGNTRYHTRAFGFGEDLAQARDNSIVDCRGLSKTPGNCKPTMTLCADGRGGIDSSDKPVAAADRSGGTSAAPKPTRSPVSAAAPRPEPKTGNAAPTDPLSGIFARPQDRR